MYFQESAGFGLRKPGRKEKRFCGIKDFLCCLIRSNLVLTDSSRLIDSINTKYTAFSLIASSRA